MKVMFQVPMTTTWFPSKMSPPVVLLAQREFKQCNRQVCIGRWPLRRPQMAMELSK